MQDMVYVTNTCRCRPPDNRKPTVIEQNACTYYLNHEVAIVQPKVIVGLGRTAIRSICPNSVLGIPDRTVFWFNEGTILIPFIGTYHPAAPLYQGNDPSMIRTIRRHLFTAKSLAARELSKV
jgi:uracil-DNA glycosylase family 4